MYKLIPQQGYIFTLKYIYMLVLNDIHLVIFTSHSLMPDVKSALNMIHPERANGYTI